MAGGETGRQGSPPGASRLAHVKQLLSLFGCKTDEHVGQDEPDGCAGAEGEPR